MNAVVRCSECQLWNKTDVNCIPPYGRCRLADEDWGGPMKASEDVGASDPHLLTKPDFGCICGVSANDTLTLRGGMEKPRE